MPDDLFAGTATNPLVRYDAARHALAEAVRIDDVKQIRDLAVAAQLYAQQAKDFEMINNATEIRERAERRAGEILIEMKERGERETGKGNRNPALKSHDATPKLTDLGISKTQSSRWQAKARLSGDQFEKHIERVKRKAIDAANKPTVEVKRQRRAEKETALAEATIAAAAQIGRQLYGVIYADPPWRFEPYSRDTGMDRAADNHYQTMALDEIKALQVPAADHCVLFLWATIPMLPQAFEVMSAWGFTYKSQFAWVKDKAGTGYWTREKHELLLIGTRGDIPAPAPGEQYESAIVAPRGKHSEKPFCFYEMIEEMFPNLPRLEMFSRANGTGSYPPGWDFWGNEAPDAAA